MSIQRYTRQCLLNLYRQWSVEPIHNEEDFQQWLLDEEYYEVDDFGLYEKEEDV